MLGAGGTNAFGRTAYASTEELCIFDRFSAPHSRFESNEKKKNHERGIGRRTIGAASPTFAGFCFNKITVNCHNKLDASTLPVLAPASEAAVSGLKG